MFRAWILASVLLAIISLLEITNTVRAAEATPSQAKQLDEDYPRATLPDAISGDDLNLVDASGKCATVLICMAGDCPISNEFVSTIVSIAVAYQDKGVSFVGINPNGSQTLDIMAAYAREHKLPFPYVKDAGGKVSRRLLYNVTPEARVFDASGKLVYSGRIDDRYRRGGANDPNVSKDLEKALDQVLAGEAVSASRTKAVGCPLQIAAPRSAE